MHDARYFPHQARQQVARQTRFQPTVHQLRLIRWDFDGSVVLWEWDRDGDGQPELVAYDSRATADGGLAPTGSITAWDWAGAPVPARRAQAAATAESISSG